MRVCADDGGVRNLGRPRMATTNPPRYPRCKRHPRNATPEELAAIAAEMGRVGGLAAAAVRLDAQPVDLSSPQAQQQTLEKVVGAPLSGKLNSRAAQAIVSAISVSQRLYETIVLDARIKALEPAR